MVKTERRRVHKKTENDQGDLIKTEKKVNKITEDRAFKRETNFEIPAEKKAVHDCLIKLSV